MFEEIAPKRTGAFRDVFLIVVGGFVLLSLPSWIPALFEIPYLKAVYEFLVLLAVALFIFRFLRSYATEYRYVLADSVLTVYGKIGARETVLAEVHLTGEAVLIPLSEGKTIPGKQSEKPYRYSYGVSDKKSAYLLSFPMQNGKNALIFQPSAKFVEILQQLILDKSDKI